MVIFNVVILIILLVVYFVLGVVGFIDGCLCFVYFFDVFMMEYGLEFVIYDNIILFLIDCFWYGWVNENFFVNIGVVCLIVFCKVLMNLIVNFFLIMEVYWYYMLKCLIDVIINEVYCYIGCFKLVGILFFVGLLFLMVDFLLVLIFVFFINVLFLYFFIFVGFVLLVFVGDGFFCIGLDNLVFGLGFVGGFLISFLFSFVVYLYLLWLFLIVFFGVVFIFSLFFIRV